MIRILETAFKGKVGMLPGFKQQRKFLAMKLQLNERQSTGLFLNIESKSHVAWININNYINFDSPGRLF